VGFVIVEFELERDADTAIQDVRDKVSAVLRDLPSDLEPPLIEKFDIGAAPIMALALAGPQDIRTLSRFADKVVKARIQTINGVGGVDLVGDREREFHVWLNPAKLESYGLTAGDVMQALQAQNVEIPGGRLDVGDRELMLTTEGQVHSAEELGKIIVTAMGGAPVRVSDIARIEDSEEEERSYSELSGTPSVSLLVRKQAGTNTVEVAEQVHMALERIRAQLPEGMTLSVPIDNSTFIEHSIADVQFDLMFGALLAVVIILFFLHDWRATVISAIALPASVIATFGFMSIFGFTFNNMTMLALSLSIGILIDDAIVIIENIHRHLEMGKPPMKAAADATGEIGLAVMATTASIVAVFVPVAIMKGIIGRFFLQFGITVAVAVLVSLLVAFTITPAYAARLLKRQHGAKNIFARAIEWFLGGLDRVFERLLGAALRHRVVTLVVATLAFAASLSLLAVVPAEFLPPEDRGQFKVSAELPVGTDLDTTKRVVSDVAARIRQVPGVDSTFTTVGGGVQEEVNRAEIQVNLVGRKERSFSQTQAMEYIRSLFADRTDATFAVEQLGMQGGSSGGMRQAQVQFSIRGQDYGQIQESANELVAALEKSGGYVDLDTTFRGGKPEVNVTIDRDRAAQLGVPVASIALTLRTFFAGEKATELATAGDRFDVRVRLPDELRGDPDAIPGLTVRTPSGQLVKLANMVEVKRGEGPGKIERQDRQRQVTILANLEGKTLGQAVEEVNAVAGRVVPEELDTGWVGMGEVMKESFQNLIGALILAIILVYLILAAQFESFVHPFTIMLSLPLSVTGALGGLALMGMTLNIFSMIGFIMLMGLVTKNAILLVDYTNTLRGEGKERREALLRAGVVRLRPILMTTAAMVFGMLPVALALGEGGEQRAPMAVAVIGGLITSTMLTLVVVPVVYDLLDAAGTKLRRRPRAEAEPEPSPAG
jgi:HAE1 family hydrophobic/amphiphilic exporter-1